MPKKSATAEPIVPTDEAPVKPPRAPRKAKSAAPAPQEVPARSSPKEQAPAEKGPKEYGLVRRADLPWDQRKLTLFRALRSLKATSPATAATTSQLVDESGLSAQHVRHYCYHAIAGNLCQMEKEAGTAGYKFYLTKEGQKINLDKVEESLGA